MKLKQFRYLCPKCRKEYRTLGWYKRHCLRKHGGFLPYIPKELINSRDLDHIIKKIESIEATLLKMSQGVILKHDIDIKPITREEKKQISASQTTFKQCIKELKSVFKQGFQLVERLDDMEVGIKTDEELEQLLKKKV